MSSVAFWGSDNLVKVVQVKFDGKATAVETSAGQTLTFEKGLWDSLPPHMRPGIGDTVRLMITFYREQRPERPLEP